MLTVNVGRCALIMVRLAKCAHSSAYMEFCSVYSATTIGQLAAISISVLSEIGNVQ